MFKCSVIHPGCSFEGTTGKAWKIHASRSHKGYSTEEWLQIARAASGLSSGAPGDMPPDSEAPPSSPAPAPDPVGEKFKAMKCKLAGALADISWAPVQHYAKAAPLRPEDRAILSEGWSAALEAVNVTTEFEPVEKKLTSPIWVIMIPILAMLTILAERLDFERLFKLFDQSPDEPDRGRDRPEGQRENNPGGPPDPKP